MTVAFLVTWETKMEHSPTYAFAESVSTRRCTDPWKVTGARDINDAKETLQAALANDIPYWSDGTYTIEVVGDVTRSI